MRRREIAEESFPICVALSIVLFFVSTALAVILAHDAKLRASKGSGGQPLSFQFSAKSARAPSSLKTQAGRLKARPLRGAVEINCQENRRSVATSTSRCSEGASCMKSRWSPTRSSK